ncbi:MAG: rRNA ((527)-N(7))-methyltransferase RsmG [Pseudomonadota bacterium]|jgi:16S rRNA (guanine527-N7)-methyltransferase
MNASTLNTHITAAAAELNLDLDSTQIHALTEYALLLHKWNAAYNLSAFKTLSDIVIKHIFDCMAVVQPITERLSLYPLSQRKMLDVGTGAGLPGIVLAICVPNIEITMLDAVQKKILFIKQAIGTLRLYNAQAHGVRIQDWQGIYSVITARAWTALADIALLTEHCIQDNGCIAAMKGPRLLLEAENLPNNWQIKAIHTMTVPHLNEARSLAFLERITTIKY